MLTWLEALAPFVPLLQTVTWVVLIGVGLAFFRKQCKMILDAIRLRIERGSSIKAGPIELGEDLRELEYVKPTPDQPKEQNILSATTTNGLIDWPNERNALYENSRGVFLAHVLEPSGMVGQQYDIFIFLVRHKSEEFDDIESAEFFFGHYWGNKVFREEPKDGLIGISTSAYGPFLCTCRITFRDGHVALIHRYIDFEMGRIFEKMPPRPYHENN
ncbi:MAG: pYEATS domain-containing protein [Thermodesulfobacteriota bacterium]